MPQLLMMSRENHISTYIILEETADSVISMKESLISYGINFCSRQHFLMLKVPTNGIMTHPCTENHLLLVMFLYRS